MSNVDHFWYKTVNNSWTKTDIKYRLQRIGDNANKRNFAKFQDQGFLFVRKLKGKENVKTNIEKMPILCTTFYRKPMQLSNFDGILYELRNWIFFTQFSPIDPFEIEEDKKGFPSNVQFLAL